MVRSLIAPRNFQDGRAFLSQRLMPRLTDEGETFGRPIYDHQAIQFKLAEMATKLQAARLMTYDAAKRADLGERVDLEAGMAKLFASEAAFEIARTASHW